MISIRLKVACQIEPFNQKPLYRGLVTCIDAMEIRNTSLDLLRKDPYYFIEHPEQKRYEVKNLLSRAKQKVNAVVFSRKNCALFEDGLKRQFETNMPTHSLAIYSPPYDQAYNQIFDAASSFNNIKPEIKIYIDNLEDICWSDDDAQNLDLINKYCDLIEEAHLNNNGISIVHTLSQGKGKGCDLVCKNHTLDFQSLTIL